MSKVSADGRYSGSGWVLATACAAALALAAPRAPAQGVERANTGGGVGQELKQVEKGVQDPAAKAPRKAPDVKLEKPKNGAPAPAAAAPPGPTFDIKTLTVRGDRDFLLEIGVLPAIEDEVVGRKLSASEIRAMAERYRKQLIERGYYLANLWPVPVDYSKGEVVIEVDKGRLGRMRFHPADAPKEDFHGRHFSESQLRLRLRGLEEGRTFDYTSLYATMFAINSHPDLTLDTDLVVRNEAGKRYADMEFFVKEDLPLHAVLSVANSGTEATGDWRPSLTLQHLNITRADDILSFSLGPISEDVQSMTSYGASYYRPFYSGNGGGVTVYGGYSDLDAEDVVTDIDIRGEGYFAGMQGSYRAIANDAHVLSVSLGVVYRSIEDQIILAATDEEEEFATDPRKVTLLPLSIGLSYSSARPDALGGRNYFTSLTSGNFEGFPGVSDEEEIRMQRLTAEATYFIERIQLARIQPLFASAQRRHWTLFARADGQIASGALVPAEQKAIGGMDTVRGFPERIVQGDHGLSGSVELRTPVIADWHRRLGLGGSREDAGRTSLLEFVVFVDGGFVKIEDSMGTEDQFTLGGAGAGFRMEITSHAQLRFDWGIPIAGRDDVDTTSIEDISSGGRYHISAQIQF